jgi:4-amino-4-deoxy-L-arabinose transferase-like glycosyltransferase
MTLPLSPIAPIPYSPYSLIFAAMKSYRHLWTRWIPVLLFATACYFPIFLHLDKQPFKNFDESLFALRALKLAHYGEYLDNFKEFPGGQTATSLKPPFVTWLQAVSFKALGYNELALRLPVALFVLFLVGIMPWYARKQFGQNGYGYFSALVLLCSSGFIVHHVSRTGDHDAALAVLHCLALMSYFRYLQIERSQPKWLYATALLLAAAVLTKSIAGLILLPAYLVYTLYQRQLGAMLRERQTWTALACLLLPIAAHYGYMEWTREAYFEKLWRGELGGHYFETRNNHRAPFNFYLQLIWEEKYQPWALFLPLSAVLLAHPRLRAWRDWGIFLWIAALNWLLVISFSQTKLIWYDATLYPFFAWMVGLVLWSMYQGLVQDWGKKTPPYRSLLTAAFLLLFFFQPYRQILKRVYMPQDLNHPGEYAAYLMEKVAQEQPDLQRYKLLYRPYSMHAVFYQFVYNEEKGYEIERIYQAEALQPGDYCLSCDPAEQQQVQALFEVEGLHTTKGCWLYRVEERK